jgi:Protein of unknown function (DUF4242)
MRTFAIMRRHVCDTREELDKAGERSNFVREGEMAGQMSWIRSYFFEEANGSIGTICVYEAESAAVIQEHARRALIPADEILPITETVVKHPDPEPVSR